MIQLLYGGVCKSRHANYLWHYRVNQSAGAFKLITYESASLRFPIALFFAYGGQDYPRFHLLLVISLHTKQQSGNMSSYSETSSGKLRFESFRGLDLITKWTTKCPK